MVGFFPEACTLGCRDRLGTIVGDLDGLREGFNVEGLKLGLLDGA
jgi:hypothetical protein